MIEFVTMFALVSYTSGYAGHQSISQYPTKQECEVTRKYMDDESTGYFYCIPTHVPVARAKD